MLMLMLRLRLRFSPAAQLDSAQLDSAWLSSVRRRYAIEIQMCDVLCKCACLFVRGIMQYYVKQVCLARMPAMHRRSWIL